MKCYLCGSEKNFQRKGKVRDNQNIKILECCDCGLVFLDSQDIDDSFYANGNMHDLSVYQLTQRTDFINDTYLPNKSRLEFILNSIVGKDILDFGSGYAGFLIQAKPFVRSASGVEIEQQVEEIYKNNNINLYRNLDEVDLKLIGEGYDVITAFHVVEHLQDPISILKKLSSKLKDNGKMIVEVPNANDALLTIYKNKAFSEFTYWSPHIFLYSPHTLKKLGEKAGLRVEFVKCVQRYPLSNTLYWLANGLPAGQKHWGNFIDNPILQNAYEQTLASLGATDTLIAQFSKI
ncbi:TPA: class I SAM-dependent methyltransferase [Campylobacter lari]|uniref:class I SAM-dependent methyltransferase n=1 Tax=Campylobacter sp. IFREMER_LSEM_CL1890 TaxID=2911615 RepID=UPI0021E6D08D|nr:class I SAM-dependent methyltransferase [Campylobacter sp. IFREMER_LSEM_CL1890]MCV3409999.1 class I SAM-dependent methyltransferase [Campylobacter sp. IFREMER_LSEM_CL1890]HEC1798077.1 class I SAM-dependent methyltransferase [Campylobacter lari]